MKVLKAIARAILKRNSGLRKLVRRQLQSYRSARYKKMSEKKRIQKKLVLFESYMGRQYACNPKAIYEEMLKDPRFDDFEFVWFFQDVKKAALLPDSERTAVVEYASAKYYELYAQAGYAITNSNIKNHVTKRQGQKFIQTWHGTPLKRLRCDIRAEHGNANNTLEEIKLKNDIDIIRYDGFLSPSAFCSEKFISAFNLKSLGLENIIIEEGYPRNDFLYNYTSADVRKIKEKLGIEKENKKIILYAPTFRDNRHDARKGYVYDVNLDFGLLRELLGDEYIILFRPHYFIANSFDFNKYGGFVYNAADIDDVNELYIITDLLITDYSSVFFDFANLRRPMIFYMYDLEEYKDDIRGFYLSTEELPGEIVTTEEALIEAIKQMRFEYDSKYKAFNEKFNYLDDGCVSKRVIDRIFTD